MRAKSQSQINLPQTCLAACRERMTNRSSIDGVATGYPATVVTLRTLKYTAQIEIDRVEAWLKSPLHLQQIPSLAASKAHSYPESM